MPGSISIETLETCEGSFRLRSTHSVDSWTIITAAATTLSCTSKAEPASQGPEAMHHSRSHLPDTSADLTRNWLTMTAPPPFSRKGVVDVVMPVKATRPQDGISRQKKRTLSTSSRIQQEEGRRTGCGRHRHAVSQLQSEGSMRVQQSEEGKRDSDVVTEERTLGWVTLSRGMSTTSSHCQPGLRERKKNGNTHKNNDCRGVVTNKGEVGLDVADGDRIEGRKLRRKWPWDGFLKNADKRLGKKDTL